MISPHPRWIEPGELSGLAEQVNERVPGDSARILKNYLTFKYELH